jgi:hypothetical protein
MKKENIIEGKNGLRNYGFEKVKKDKVTYHTDPDIGIYTQKYYGMFYTKQCLYCQKSFEARRVDTSFCCQGCQKAHLRQRNRITN